MEKSVKKNSILNAQSISKLIEKISKNPNTSAELKYIKNECISSEDVPASLTAAKALVVLVENGTLKVSDVLSELISSVALTKSVVGINAAVCDLLMFDLRCKINSGEKYKCPFNLRAPQHPLILILNQQSTMLTHIVHKINGYYENEQEKISFYANEVLYPLYMYVICNPTSEVPELISHKLWNLLIKVKQKQSIDIIVNILMWLQLSRKSHSVRTADFLTDLMNTGRFAKHRDLQEVVVLWLTSLIYELIIHGHDPHNIIALLHDYIHSHQDLQNVISVIAVMLAQCITACPSVYLLELLKLCKAIISLNRVNKFGVYAIKIALLQWLAYSCVLTKDSWPIINDIIAYIDHIKEFPKSESMELYKNKLFYTVNTTNLRVNFVVEIVIISESLNAFTIVEWLTRLNKLPPLLLKDFYIYLAALLLYKFDNTDIYLKIIALLLKITNVCKELTTHFLILILCNLSSCCNPKIQFALLKALPKMAAVKENLPFVLNTLELLKGSMLSFSLTLYYELWNVDRKYYPHLQNALMAMGEMTEGPTKWEYYVTKAYILKQICLESPHIYGRELVGHLSDVLNRCKRKTGALASSLALEGIKALCNEGVIDIISTWEELEPVFSKETRTPVIKSLCALMAELSYFDPSDCPDKVLESIISKLWNYLCSHDDDTINVAAANALKSFTLEQASPYLPDTYKIQSLNSFGLLEGECWINLMLNSKSAKLDTIGDILIKFVSSEISNYRSSVYKVDQGQREPQNLNYLPETSIVRALGNYLRQQIHKLQDSSVKSVYLQCLRVLSQEYSKSLPPTDWCFLQEIIHIPEARSNCVTLASHQVQLSGTARRLIENYIPALTNILNDDDINTIYTNLKYLCNSIQPMTLRPFVEKSMAFALEKALTSKGEEILLYKSIITHIKTTLSDDSLLESNRLVLSQVVLDTGRSLDVSDPLFKELLKCVVVLPIRFIDELSSPRLWKGEPSEGIKLSVKVRCALATNASVTPLTWMNDFIDAACFMPLEHEYVLKNIARVLESFRDSPVTTAWTIELLGNIQSTITNESTTYSHLKFLCDVFILSVVVLSGGDIFVRNPAELVTVQEHRLRLFPLSLASLIESECWKKHVSLIAEWLYHMTNYHDTPDCYKATFYQALAALRHQDEFSKHSSWMKYLGAIVPLNVC